MLGFPSSFQSEILQFSETFRDELMRETVPKHTLQRIISVLQLAAEETAQQQEFSNLALEVQQEGTAGLSHFCSPILRNEGALSFANARVINRWTTILMPTAQEWKDQLANDPDILHQIRKIKAKEPVVHARLQNKGYYVQWGKKLLEVEEDVLYQWEHPKATIIRQLCRRGVPVALRQLVYTAYHASPLAGHVGFYKTYWRIAARYFWPGMYTDIRKAVTEHGHCVLGNNVGHHAQQISGKLSVDEPFDIIAIDIWVPGVTDVRGSYVGDKSNIRQAAVTCLCNLTVFATVGFLENMESDIITKVVMSQIILPNGLPKMVLLDEDSLFKQDLRILLDDLGVPFHDVVSAEQHEGVLCERFHRYLNKVQCIEGVNSKVHSNWMMNTSLAAYALNASPIDGTDVVRSFAAKARTFNFPLDVQEEPERIMGNPGKRALQHVEAMFPLWFKQKELLRLLILERREKHTAWANRNKTKRSFQPGDLVVIRRQVTSDASTGRPAKLRMRARGPYRVLEAAGDDS
jgi:hypothetical protein